MIMTGTSNCGEESACPSWLIFCGVYRATIKKKKSTHAVLQCDVETHEATEARARWHTLPHYCTIVCTRAPLRDQLMIKLWCMTTAVVVL
jgi:hypothetical protein